MPVTLQYDILCHFAHPLSLLVPHLNDSDPVTLGDTNRNLLTSGLNRLKPDSPLPPTFLPFRASNVDPSGIAKILLKKSARLILLR
jgi:hypothetical protein